MNRFGEEDRKGRQTMRRFMLISLAIIALDCCGADEPAAEESQARTVSVSGSAVGYVPADTVLWRVTLQSSGKDVLDAKARSDEQVKVLVDLCRQKGIEAKDIDAGTIRIQDARVSASGNRDDEEETFSVTRAVTLRQRDLRAFPTVLDMLSRRPGMRIHYDIVSSKTDEATLDTLVKATEAARRKAEAMVGVLGASLGKVLSIDEYPSNDRITPDESIPVDRSSPSFGADAKQIRITVYVTFEIQ